jgi:hypothetical protein
MMMTMNARNFFMLVTEMRNAQKMYFRNRTKEELEKSKELEKRVDDEIRHVLRVQNDPELPLLLY